MKFEVSGKALQEAKRTAAAFGVKEWSCVRHNVFRGDAEVCWVQWELRYRKLFYVAVGREEDTHTTSFYAPRQKEKLDLMLETNFLPGEHEVMACGLYCLGFEDERALAQLPALSAHEKIELRLSMPREFWPRTWLDEED